MSNSNALPSAAPSTLEPLDTGIIYRNPKPHVRSVHTYFPSVALLSNGEMLSTLVLGEAFEATDLETHIARSADGGKSWQLEGRLYEGTPDRLTSNASRLTALPNNEAVAFMVRADRTAHPDEGLASAETMGFAPVELLLFRSKDGGQSWSGAETLNPPLVGPAFELCAPITLLRDGRWIIPTSTWRSWDGYCPNGTKMVALVSYDAGRSWPEYWDVMNDTRQEIIYWESKIVELADGRLLAVAWAYDETQGKDLPNHYAVSTDGGKSWTTPQSTGLQGQTLTPLVLDDNRILCVYRRMDEPGLWAQLLHLDEDGMWINDESAPLWGSRAQGLTSTTTNMAHNFNVLRFGAPSLTLLPDGIVFVAFWCYEDYVSNVRWITLRV